MTRGTTAAAVRRGGSLSADVTVAAREFHAQVSQDDAALVVFFASPEYDFEKLTAELRRLFGDAPLIGCTTAGEISPLGYHAGGLSGLSLPGVEFDVATGIFGPLEEFQFADGTNAARDLLDQVTTTRRGAAKRGTFGLLLVDGVSMMEEAVVSSIYQGLTGVPLFGGSAGDGTRFQRTWVYADGGIHANAAVLTLVSTDRPFTVFKTEHFVSTPEKMVVTKADPSRRIVREINGLPAGEEYARLVGLAQAELTPFIFASHPVVVRLGGRGFVRSIQQVNPDGSLTFFCAIDEGIVLSLARGVDIVENLRDALRQVESEIGTPDLIIGCDCILRSLELDQSRIKATVAEILREYNVVGFSTYGEQFNSMHVNQTFTGVGIGLPE